jgi:ribosomal protein L37AE/L43A
MSKCVHSKSTYKLRKLPKCSRCKQEFMLVYFSYGQGKPAIPEWECQKCHKVVKQGLLKEEDPSEDYKFFEMKSKEIQAQNEANERRDRRAALRGNLKSRS